MTVSICVLLVDDEPDLANMTSLFLQREHDAIETRTETNPVDALSRLETERFDCVISDYDMPEMNGLELLSAIRDSHSELPFVLFTGKGSEEIASEAISAGVTGYLQKETGTDQYTVLANVVENAVEKYRAERALREEQAFTESALNSLSDIFYAVDSDYEFLRWNDTIGDETGYSDDDIAEMRLTDLVADDVAADLDSIFAAETGVFETCLRTSDGDTIPYEFRGATFTDSDGTVGICGVGRDITERQCREEELRRSERRFEAIFNDPFSFIGLLETDGTVMQVNQTALDAIDGDVEQVEGKPFWETPWWNVSTAVQDELRDRIADARDGKFVHFRAENRTAESDSLVLDVSIRPVRGESGAVETLIAEGRSVERLKERVEDLE
ncbi:PAS domain-containing response regulator [Haladaptatus cibarius]|uniref:PAS domain-containing response regulator n=1 Tax=Haladaptatus cibarius TaxID=453847 RepID=UPI0009FE6C5A|nr:response regulator [Haladaptatus cibarius]